ncbi:uncharacterized protein [Apostichopus japonicus]|uniref:uncharacterized protein isoform X2 n=1 Tax=Stichopus japonicus TaxID=307972 RepID=UPI003AB852C6
MIRHINTVTVFLYAVTWMPLTAAAVTELSSASPTNMVSITQESQANQPHDTCMMNKNGSHQSILPGTSTNLTCCINNTNTSIWWFNHLIVYHGGQAIGTEHNLNVTLDEEYTRLHIINSTTNNTGEYKCTLGNKTISIYKIDVRVPISKLFLEVSNDSDYYILCFGDQQPTEPFVWRIDGEIAVKDSYVVMHNTSEGFVNASILILPRSSANKTVTCEHGSVSVSKNLDEKTDDTQESIYFFWITGASAVIILVIASFSYVVFTYAYPISKDQESRRSSIYSIPSTASSDRQRRADAVSKQESTEQEECDNKVQTKNESCNSFERQVQQFGINLQSFRSADALNEFWEASLYDGTLKDKFVVRSLSGKATVDLLEEFRKFQVGLNDLPSHPNVWNVLGCCTDKLPYRICYEFHISTSIREYLLGNFQSSDGLSENGVRQTQTLIALATGIANGMVFLKSYAFDHVALRTEKILIDQTTSCKLYDFCLSSQSQRTAVGFLNESELLAWLAPELIFLEEYNQWTDIWAFGVVMWELWCGGRTPHCGKSRENLELDLRNQRFLVQPNNCPGAIYSLMLSCWKNNASERKMFNNIYEELTSLKDSTDTSWYEDYEYSSLPGSTFYTVLDNNYDKGHLPNELEGYPMKEFL